MFDLEIGVTLAPIAALVHMKGDRVDRLLAEADAGIEHSPRANAGALILNRFGYSEAQRLCLCPLIDRAAGDGVAVLISVNDSDGAEWHPSCGELACDTAATPAGVKAWAEAALAATENRNGPNG